MTNSEARKRAQAAASQVQGAAEVGADVEALAKVLCDTDPTSTPTTWDHVREEHRNYRRQHAAALLAAGWVPAERVAEARAEERGRIVADIRALRADASMLSPMSYRAGRDDAAYIAETDPS